MHTYHALFRTPGFAALFASSSAQIAAQTVAGLALGTLVYAATGSALLSSLAMFGTSFAQVAGALVLLSAADRLPPRAALCGTALVFAAGTAVVAVPGLPPWALVCALLCVGLVSSLGGGVRYGLLDEILPAGGYVLGRSVLNLASGAAQVGGFAVGGSLVEWLSPRGTLLVAAGLHLLSAAVAYRGLGRRPARATGRPSPALTWRTNAALWSSPHRRAVLLALWLPNGLVVGCEALFVPYAPGRAGMMFAVAATGMLVGDAAAGRFVPERLRGRLGAPLRLLLAVPYLVFALHPPLFVALVAAGCASVGYAASLLLQEQLVALTPADVRGQALGLQSSGMLTMQGVGAALAGAVADRLGPAGSMSLMAALSVVVTLALAPRLAGARRAAEASGGGAAPPAQAASPAAPRPAPGA